MRDRASAVERASERYRDAHRVLERLGLLDRLRSVGVPHLIGSVAYDVVVDRDIDFEVDCAPLDAGAAWGVFAGMVALPGLRRIRYSNHVGDPDAGLYFQVHYDLDVGQRWKLDIWFMPDDYAGPRGRDLAEPVRRAILESGARETILLLKEAVRDYRHQHLLTGAFVYHAVVDGGVMTSDEFKSWFESLGDEDWLSVGHGWEQLARRDGLPSRVPVFRPAKVGAEV